MLSPGKTHGLNGAEGTVIGDPCEPTWKKQEVVFRHGPDKAEKLTFITAVSTFDGSAFPRVIENDTFLKGTIFIWLHLYYFTT